MEILYLSVCNGLFLVGAPFSLIQNFLFSVRIQFQESFTWTNPNSQIAENPEILHIFKNLFQKNGKFGFCKPQHLAYGKDCYVHLRHS